MQRRETKIIEVVEAHDLQEEDTVVSPEMVERTVAVVEVEAPTIAQVLPHAVINRPPERAQEAVVTADPVRGPQHEVVGIAPRRPEVAVTEEAPVALGVSVVEALAVALEVPVEGVPQGDVPPVEEAVAVEGKISSI